MVAKVLKKVLSVSSVFEWDHFCAGGPRVEGTFFRHKSPQLKVKGVCGEKMFRGPVERKSGLICENGDIASYSIE